MEIWTPRQQLARDKWRKRLVEIQYNNVESAEELHKRLHEEGEAKAKAENPSFLDIPDKPQVQETEELNGGDYALHHYKPRKKWGR